MAAPEEPTRVNILGRPTIHVAYDLLRTHVASDLLQNVKADPSAKINFALVTDTNLAPLYLPAFKTSFQETATRLGSNDKLITYEIPPGESSKSRDTVGAIHDWLALNGCQRDTVVIALGGGVVGDMIGYAAATYMRGVPVIQIPTTLLSMVDSSIGGKTAIDTPYGKNLVGAFHQPKRVYIDLKFLSTLPNREIINGMAEVIKTAAIWDAEEFARLEDDADAVQEYLAMDRRGKEPSRNMMAILKRIILGSARIKAEVVSADEKEGGLRNLLNFGHSIGHAMEAILFPQILHGECVSIGMVKEAELSRFLGILQPGAVARLTKCLASYGLPVSLKDAMVRKRSANRKCPVDDLIRIMAVDKKNAGGKKRIVLLSEIGKTYEPKATAVGDDDIRVILSPSIRIRPGYRIPQSITCRPPGSKSISNRALLLAALGSGQCRMRNLLHSDDTQVMLSALAKLGAAEFCWEENGQVLVVNGKGGRMSACKDELYLGNAGTASRFLTTAAALAHPADAASIILTGNARMKERPVGPLVESLQANGIQVSYKERQGSLPVEVAAAGGLNGGEINLAATLSSQYVSSLLMCAPYAKQPVTLRLVGGKPISQAYIDMTIAMMATFGVKVQRSKTEDHTYHIPAQSYQNPSEYEIESDASSATYPLAIAAISGTTCTIPNIGTASLQGDAKFAVDVLGPMGCTVEQTERTTTVTGPPVSKLKPLPHVDMEPMTDAFLTASVLAAVAQTSTTGSTTHITGIANQHVKECDRIKAMHDQLAKFGVTTVEEDDGIQVQGRGLDLGRPSSAIHCYDDHRVAMSFSVLALASSSEVIIEDKECTAKTWPGWWDTLKQEFKVPIEGFEPHAVITNGVNGIHAVQNEKSIFLIGMRGAGKTTKGKWASPVLDWPFVDLDHELVRVHGMSIDEMIEQRGWQGFRQAETDMLLQVMKERPQGHIFGCGGGVVESEINRNALKAWTKSGGIVLSIGRSIEGILDYLNQDKTRPAYLEGIKEVWERRKPWYQECSNFQYYGTRTDALLSPHALEINEREKFCKLLSEITGMADSPLKALKTQRHQSFFLSLTFPKLQRELLPMLQSAVIGSNAIELRVDLLEDPQSTIPGVPTVDFVISQVSFLKAAFTLPIIFTIRTQSQSGKFPDTAVAEALELYKTAQRLACEFIDLELTWPDSLLENVTSSKPASTSIIASHHDPKSSLSWKTGSWVPFYNRALQYGDVIKLVGMANSLSTNDDLETFRAWAHTTNPDTPLIAINMGSLGKLSRVRNRFMTPVSHPSLPFKAAPGQLSVAEINTASTLIGAIEAQKYYIFGKPIAHSRSPALHNTLFSSLGLPHSYERHETDVPDEAVQNLLRSPDFGGASVTIPIKQSILPHLDELDAAAKLIGAVNTIVPERVATSSTGPTNKLVGYNTDHAGISRCLRDASCLSDPGAPAHALVLGGGGTARAAIYALHSAGFSPIYLLGRNASKMVSLSQNWPTGYDLRVLESGRSYTTKDLRLGATDGGSNMDVSAIVGTVPGDVPMDEATKTTFKSILEAQSSIMEQGGKQRVFLEMAYKPLVTEAMKMAQAAGFSTVAGREALVAQGMEQFRLWTGVEVQKSIARQAVFES